MSWYFQFYGSLQISGFIEAKRNGVKTIKAFPLGALRDPAYCGADRHSVY